MVCDVTTSVVSSVIALLVAQLIRSSFGFRFAITWVVGAAVASAIMFLLLRTYRTIVRYSTFQDVGKICLAIIGKEALLAIIAGTFIWNWDAPVTGKELTAMLMFDLVTTICALIAVRIVIMLGFDAIKKRYMQNRPKNQLLIYAGQCDDKAVSLVTRLRTSKHYRIVGFLDYGKRLAGNTLSGLPVYFFTNEKSIEYLHDNLGIDGIIFAHDEDVKQEEERLIIYCQKHGLKTLISPSIDDMADGKPLNTHSIRKIKIEDLLNRPEIKISMREIINNFHGKTILVTGAAGSIGSELCRQLATFGIKELVMFDNAETPLHNVRLEFEQRFPNLKFTPIIGDVRQSNRLDYVFRKFHPQVVFHAAAYKHVPLMEENPCEAVRVNVIGSRNVADKCVEYNVETMVMISTDKAVNPTNIMGCTKRLAEIYVQSLGNALDQNRIKGSTRFVTTRFGNVLGSNGSVIPYFTQQIENGGPVTVTHPEIERFFMTIPEACRLVMEAATLPFKNTIFVFDMGQPVKIRHLAEQMIRLAGFEVDKDISIEYCGLRPGEKLYEEVLADKENTVPTPHERIRVAKVRDYDYNDACMTIDTLDSLSERVNIPEMVITMKHAVPEFKSNNSPYEKFDKIVEEEIAL